MVNVVFFFLVDSKIYLCNLRGVYKNNVNMNHAYNHNSIKTSIFTAYNITHKQACLVGQSFVSLSIIYDEHSVSYTNIVFALLKVPQKVV